MDREHPEALDLLSAVLLAIGDRLRGVASVVAGTHAPDHFREMLRGERTLPAYDVCRLATSGRPEAREAVEAAVGALAGALGLALTPKVLRFADPHETAARCAEVSSQAVAAILRALQDGKLDEAEKRALAPHAEQLRGVVAAIEGLAAVGV